MRQFFTVRAIHTLAVRLMLVAGLASSLAPVSTPAMAGGMGRFLGSLVARGVGQGVAAAARSSAPKVYTSDVLTVAQLAACITKASKLDGDSERLEADRTALQASKAEIDASSDAIELGRSGVDHHSQRSVNAFNAMVNRHNDLVADGRIKQTSFNELVEAHNAMADAYNVDCIKKYYADDLADAQKLASQP